MSSFARRYANKHHDHINQKYDVHYYDFHINEVALIMRREKFFLPESVSDVDKEAFKSIMADVAYLHDLIKYTDITHENISLWFGDEAADIVSNITIEKSNLSQKELFSALHDKLSKLDELDFVGWGSLVVKAIERMVNTRYFLGENNEAKIKMYYENYPEFKKAAFRENVAVNMWQELDKMDEQISKKYNFTR